MNARKCIQYGSLFFSAVLCLAGCEAAEDSADEGNMTPSFIGEDDIATVCSPTEAVNDETSPSNEVLLSYGEVFYFDAINRELAQDEPLKSFVGMETVSTCEQARAFALLKQEYLDTFSLDADAADADDENSPEAEVIYGPESETDNMPTLNGIKGVSTIGGRRGVVEVHTLSSRNGNVISYSSCTGAMLSDKVIVTSAHCLVGNVAGKTGSHAFRIYYFDPDTRSRVLLVNWENLSFDIHPSYSGSGNISHDLAVIERSSSWPGTNASDYLRIYQHYGSKIGKTKLFGAGLYTCSGKSDDQLRWGNYDLDKQEYNYFRTKSGSSTRRPCHGDSGGPSIKEWNSYDLIVGVLSKSEFNNDCKQCTKPRGKIWHTRINGDKLTWIRQVTNMKCDIYEFDGSKYAKCF